MVLGPNFSRENDNWIQQDPSGELHNNKFDSFQFGSCSHVALCGTTWQNTCQHIRKPIGRVMAAPRVARCAAGISGSSPRWGLQQGAGFLDGLDEAVLDLVDLDLAQNGSQESALAFAQYFTILHSALWWSGAVLKFWAVLAAWVLWKHELWCKLPNYKSRTPYPLWHLWPAKLETLEVEHPHHSWDMIWYDLMNENKLDLQATSIDHATVPQNVKSIHLTFKFFTKYCGAMDGSQKLFSILPKSIMLISSNIEMTFHWSQNTKWENSSLHAASLKSPFAMARTKSDAAPRARGRGRGLKRPARALAKGHEKVAERAPETELEKAWNGGKKWAEPSKMMDFCGFKICKAGR